MINKPSLESGGRCLRVAVAGLGRIGDLHATHLFGEVPFAELVAVADIDAGRAADVGERFGVGWTTDVEALLGDDTVDAVVLATPTTDHPDHVEAAARAGKAIFCEKPLGLDETRTRDVIETAESCGVPLQVGLHRRFDPDTRRVKELVGTELGSPYYFRTSLRDMTPQPMEYIKVSGSFFVDVSIHDLDLARWLMGEITQVTAVGSSVSDPAYAEIGTVDQAVIIVRFESGALGVIDNSRIAGYGYEASTEVVGSSATARIDHSHRTDVTVLSAGTARRDHVVDFVDRFRDAYRLELVAFVEAVRREQVVPVTGWDALAAFVLASAADRSWQTSEPVELDVHHGPHGAEYAIRDCSSTVDHGDGAA